MPSSITIEEKVDAGGQGEVYKGSMSGQDVAVKILELDNTEKERVDREIDLLSNINSPNIVSILSSGTFHVENNDVHYIVYEFLTGGNLKKCIDDTKDLTEEELKNIGRDIANAINIIWSRDKKVVHRDIKPENIMKRGFDYVLVDFGFSRHVDQTSLTLVGHTCGTPGYMSPEQIIGRKALTNNSDTFSLGVTLYYLASKVHPFQNRNADLTDYQFIRLKNHRSDLSDEFCDIVEKMLQLKAIDRPKDLVSEFNY